MSARDNSNSSNQRPRWRSEVPERRSRDRWLRVWRCFPWPITLASALAAVLAAGLIPAAAQADQLTVFSCHTPGGRQVGVEGWKVASSGQEYLFAKDGCAPEGKGTIEMEVAASAYGYPNGAGIGWTFTAPSWASIAAYTIHVAGSDTYRSEAGIDGQAAIYASDEAGGVYDYRNLDGGLWGAQSVQRTPPDAVHWITASASCDGEGGPCPTGTLIARLNLASTAIVLNDSGTPTVSGLAGALVSPGVLRGAAEASFNATDEGPGVYSARLILDGEEQQPLLLDSNNGLCTDLGETGDGTRSFSSATPCAKSTSGSVTLDTAALKDGKHTLKLIVDDAAGDQTTAFDGTITTNNAPEDTVAPAISSGGQAQVGTVLGSQPGQWSAPQGAGSTTYAYQWQSCDGSGEGCTPIAGAESASYTPAPADVGHTLRVAVTAADSDGATTVSSAPSGTVMAPAGSLGAQPGPGTSATSPISPPPSGAPSGSPKGGTASSKGASGKAVIRLGIRRRITRSFKHRALHLRGRLLDTHHHPIAHAMLTVLQRIGHGRWQVIGHANSGVKGRFVAQIRPGPSRTIELAYKDAGRHDYAATAKVHEKVRAGVRLHIRPLRTSRTGTIVLTGRVLGHVPPHGVLVALLVHYRGKWVPFRDPHTNRKGRFKVAYRFQGAVGSFPFRAQVPGGQASFPFAAGTSEVIHVRTS
jgi:hypothetical protein